jgi:Ca2+:H+ antiporter
MRPWVGWSLPAAAITVLAGTRLTPVGAVMAFVGAVALIAAVIACVHHAEVIAHRVGEPFGALLLSLCVTVIEVALIATVMLAGDPDKAVLARDAIFSVIMITCNGLVGVCLLIGALRHREQSFRIDGVAASLATLIVLSSLSLVLPSFTTSAPGATYTRQQLLYASIAALVLWVSFVFVQAIRHRDYFLPPTDRPHPARAHAARPAVRQALLSFGLLLVGLVSVVGLAHAISPVIERTLVAAGAPASVASIAIASLTLLPEGWSAVRAAIHHRLQTSLNLSLGSALASIGLTIPVVAQISLLTGVPIVLGLAAKEMALLLLTFLVASITLGTGRTHLLQGVVHLVIFGSFLFFALVP